MHWYAVDIERIVSFNDVEVWIALDCLTVYNIVYIDTAGS